ncbi:hypothetical protein [Reticulibacter mediterranei]|uniref:hypothetical protein n=1 Tax=Reticulibacter mediterranei TaxID=2778369 RepID=UPI001C692FFE|nr:hypothetical protein [Reticulibacter mediterranei]
MLGPPVATRGDPGVLAGALRLSLLGHAATGKPTNDVARATSARPPQPLHTTPCRYEWGEPLSLKHLPDALIKLKLFANKYTPVSHLVQAVVRHLHKQHLL